MRGYRAGRLDGQVALLTGGDSGIGRAVAIAFARKAQIINTASVTAYPGSPHLVDYASTKGAIVFLATDESAYFVGQVLHPNGVEIINT
jgi:NAD(P)-dependent dehydrogenase (short-subunit alcohol dehydrogenase family)